MGIRGFKIRVCFCYRYSERVILRFNVISPFRTKFVQKEHLLYQNVLKWFYGAENRESGAE